MFIHNIYIYIHIYIHIYIYIYIIQNQILCQKAKEYDCNCRNKESCPLQNQCLTLKVIYEATVVNHSDGGKQIYFSSSDTTFKKRYRNHTRDFNHERYSKCTELSK